MGCVQTVPNDRVAVITRFGKFDRLAHPGLLCLPIPCICVRAGDVSVAVQYEVIKSKIYEAFYRLHNPTVQINSYVFDVVRSTVPCMLLDDVFESKDEVAKQVKDQLQKIMSEFGFQINQALVTDISPNRKVRDAMNEINANRRLRVAATEKAEAEKVVIVKQAEAEAESKYLQGQGVARQRKAIVDGLRESVGDFQEAIHEMSAKDVLELVLVTQYFDTLKEVGSSSKANTVFVSTSQKGVTDEIKMGVMQARAGSGLKFDGLTLTGRTARLDIRAVMPALEEGFDGGVNVAKEGKIKWTFTENNSNESTYWKMPEYAHPNLPAKIEIEPSLEENTVLISISQTAGAEMDHHEAKRISVEVGPGDLKGIQIVMQSMLPYLYGWTLIPVDVGEKWGETKQRGYSVGQRPTSPSQSGGPSADDFFD
ncbi:HIR complex subunit [Perkinsus chesapeaki]|uniref:HIR complex subunit n=1 Tax=Perkinsus chesapeaki TaxID=330153 RepID=A0A7J6L2H2_PERCH|nr:HIR complex subunit [Perkinsus chesapeaki]